MTCKQGRIATLRLSLRAGAAALALTTMGVAILPGDAAWAQAAPAPAEQTSRYHVRLMRQEFDGAREYSHTQTAGVAHLRRGDESWLEINFGRGALVSAVPGTTSVGGFDNISGVEAGMAYNHATHMLSGDPGVADFHNRHVRPLLGRAPAGGGDATWTVSATPAQLGLAALGAQPMTIEISRRRFRHDGRDYVLLHYRLPSFTYAAQGRPVVHWGEGVALIDAANGQVYWNAALHRAVASEAGGSGRPYRMARTMAALDARGRPLLDPRRIAETAPYFARLYGHANDEVMGFVTRDGQADPEPLTLASRIDILALSLAEDGAGPAAQLASAYAQGQRGQEVALPPPAPLARARAARARRTTAAAPSASVPQAAPAPSEANAGGGGGDAMKRADAFKGGGQQPQMGPPPPPTIGPPPQPTIGPPPQPTIGPAPPPQTGPTSPLPTFTIPAETQAEVDNYNRGRAAITNVVNWTQITQASQEEARLFDLYRDALTVFQARSQKLRGQIETAQAELADAQERLARPTSVDRVPDPNSAYGRITGEADQSRAAMNRLYDAYQAAAPEDRRAAYQAWSQAEDRHAAALDAFLEFDGPYEFADVNRPPGAIQTARAQEVQRRAAAVVQLEADLTAHGADGVNIAARIQEIPRGRFAAFTERLGRILGPVGIAFDSYTIGASLNNLRNETGRDLSQGQLNLTRQYGVANPWAYLDIALDLGGMAGSLATGDRVGFFFSAAAIATSSITDIVISAQGMVDTDRAVGRAQGEAVAIQIRAEIRASAARRAQMEADLAEIEADLAAIERSPELARELLEERRRNRAEAARQAEAERQRLIAEARAENERIYQENLRRPPTAEEWAQFNRDIEAAMRPDYPTAPPPTPAQIAERLERAERARRQELAEAGAAAAAAAAEARARQQAVAEANAGSVARREAEAQARRERNERRAEGGLDIQPVNFQPPTFRPPVFTPPVWVPPVFDPPDPSQIPWTNFDDDDWPGGTGNLAYQYGNMSGRVETDLSRWAEWLATQNVRELTRIALNAGYPNLASALNDAENIIRLSRDEGYRRWAMTAPSCNGSSGCGPSYLELWAMKQSTVLLGDILAQSRDIFSTGGFSDIGISGLNLSYLLRDNALQDGDIVDVRIEQFGRVLFQGRTNLTNIGDRFNFLLRQGVASLEIFAVNEGSAPPNTAQISIDNVVRGQGIQSYSLRTGQTATLRIETNATGQ